MPPPQTQTEVGPVTTTGPDPSVVNLAKAIRTAETSNTSDAYTKPGASGEYGAYQFEPTTWTSLAPKYGVSVPLNQASPQQQNAVAYNYILDLKNQGYNPAQIASIWNSGSPDPSGKVGTNSYGVSYDTPAYVQKVYSAYEDYKTGAQTAGTATPPPSVDSAQQTYGATFPASPDDNAFVAALKAAGNLPSSIINFGEGIGNTLLHPIQTAETLATGAIGGVENATGQNPGQPDQYQQTANAIGQAFLNRYGSLDAARQSAENDPFGVGTDVASLFAGGAGLLGKGAEATELATSAVRPLTGGIDSLVGGAVSKAAAPFAGSIDSTVAGAADRLGVDLPAASLSKSPIVQGLENVASKGIGGDTYLERVAKATDDLNTAADSIAAEAGGTDDLAQAGQNVVKGFDDFKSAFFKQNDAVYSALEEKAGDVAAQTQNSLALIDKIIQEKEQIGDTNGVAWFKNKRAVLAGSKGDAVFVPEGEKMVKIPAQKYSPPTFSTLKKLRTSIGELQKSKFSSEFVSTNDRQIQALYGSLSQDMGATLKATGDKALFQLWQKGNADYVKGIQLINSTYGKTIQRLADAGQYDKIISSIVKPSMSALDIQKIFQVVGDQGTKEIRSSLLTKVFNDARTENADGVLQFKPQSLATQIKKYVYGDDNKLKDILTPEQYGGLQDMQTVAASLAKAQSLTKGGLINSIRTYGELGAVGYAALNLLKGDVVGAVKDMALVGMEQGASYFLASDTGQKLLTYGLRNKTLTEEVINDLGLNKKVNSDNVDTNDKMADMGGAGGNTDTSGTTEPDAGGAVADTDSGNRVVPAVEPGAVSGAAKEGGASGEQGTQEAIKNFPRDTTLKGKGAQLQDDSIAHYVNNKDELLKQYLAANGKTVNTDEARKLFTDVGYNGTNSAAVHEASSQLSKDAFASLLKTEKPGDALIMAGGSGGGKSTAVRAMADSPNTSLIFDGNSSKYEGLLSRYNEAKDAGHTPVIKYIYRDPIEAWNNGVISRMKDSSTDKGRVVPLKTFLENTSGSMAVAKRANQEGLSIDAYRNSAEGVEKLSSEDLHALKLPRTLQTRLTRDTEEMAASGVIKKREYNALMHGLPHEDYDTLREET